MIISKTKLSFLQVALAYQILLVGLPEKSTWVLTIFVHMISSAKALIPVVLFVMGYFLSIVFPDGNRLISAVIEMCPFSILLIF